MKRLAAVFSLVVLIAVAAPATSNATVSTSFRGAACVNDGDANKTEYHATFQLVRAQLYRLASVKELTPVLVSGTFNGYMAVSNANTGASIGYVSRTSLTTTGLGRYSPGSGLGPYGCV